MSISAFPSPSGLSRRPGPFLLPGSFPLRQTFPVVPAFSVTPGLIGQPFSVLVN